jgi:hypothetical protein
MSQTTNFKTEQEKKQQELLNKIILNHCVACHQQLDLLQLRLINFEDLVEGVRETLRRTSYELKDHKENFPHKLPENLNKQPKLTKV